MLTQSNPPPRKLGTPAGLWKVGVGTLLSFIEAHLIMRLLHTSAYELKEFIGSNIPAYAILSHTWEGTEVLFSDLQDESTRKVAELKKDRSWKKVLGTCKRARDDGLEWVWIDTCCINKESSTELSQALNSMFRYYQDAFVCYTYLSDYHIENDSYPDELHGNASFQNCHWFTRGWTLQELLAPDSLVFLDAEWRDMGSRFGLREAISKVTGIPSQVLEDGDLEDYSVAAKMSWAAGRQTTQEEDIAYSLMGIFGVNFPPLYGEGADRAFMRLQEEIIKYSSDQSIFAWSAPSGDDTELRIPQRTYRGLLARSPSEFKTSGDVRDVKSPFWEPPKPQIPYTLTNLGLCIHLPIKPVRDCGGQPQDGLFVAILNCTVPQEEEQEEQEEEEEEEEYRDRTRRLAIYLQLIPYQGGHPQYERFYPGRLVLLSAGQSIDDWETKEIYVKEFLRNSSSMRPRSRKCFVQSVWEPKTVVSFSSSTDCVEVAKICRLSEYLNFQVSEAPEMDERANAVQYEFLFCPNHQAVQRRGLRKAYLVLIYDTSGQISLLISKSPWELEDLVDDRLEGIWRRNIHSAGRDRVLLALHDDGSILITARRKSGLTTSSGVQFCVEFDLIEGWQEKGLRPYSDKQDHSAPFMPPKIMASRLSMECDLMTSGVDGPFGWVDVFTPTKESHSAHVPKWLRVHRPFTSLLEVSSSSTEPAKLVLLRFVNRESRGRKQVLVIFEISDCRVCWYNVVADEMGIIFDDRDGVYIPLIPEQLWQKLSDPSSRKTISDTTSLSKSLVRTEMTAQLGERILDVEERVEGLRVKILAEGPITTVGRHYRMLRMAFEFLRCYE
ncbi:hypothetical protein D9758_010896 [Tetrapyrgos nigripes]|uniref:Heterokaryon incompatibility domain-containing protein n=1 Tax=Tetrapyrgos nigripes TaxID=182062 RepID=A0A8H5FSU2_9AGAR|nr:hypothetical protein D9758_010896 [Tetrapyrgos nigripes]